MLQDGIVILSILGKQGKLEINLFGILIRDLLLVHVNFSPVLDIMMNLDVTKIIKGNYVFGFYKGIASF